MRRIVSEPAPPPSTIRKDYPPALEAIVMKALEKRPEDRQQSAEEMRHDLEEFLAVGGFRTGARQTALYLRELFPIKAALSDEGVVQPKVPNDSDSAPLPIVFGSEGRRPSARPAPGRDADRSVGREPGRRRVAVSRRHDRAHPGLDEIAAPARDRERSAAGDSARPVEREAGAAGCSHHLRGHHGGDPLPALAAPDDAVASPAPPTSVEPARPRRRARRRPTHRRKAGRPEPSRDAQARARRRGDAAAVGEPAVGHEGLDAAAGVEPRRTATRSRSASVQRRQRRQVASNDPSSSRETSRLNATAPTSASAPRRRRLPVAEAPRPTPPAPAEPPPRPAARPTPRPRRRPRWSAGPRPRRRRGSSIPRR